MFPVLSRRTPPVPPAFMPAFTGPLHGALSPAVAPPPAPPAPPLWGTPPLPGSPPPKSGAVIADSVKEHGTAMVSLSCWWPGSAWSPCCPDSACGPPEAHTSLGNAERVAADGKVSSAPASQWPRQDPTDDPANRVTVPWGTTPTPQVGDVGPLQLSTDVPTLPAMNPVTPPVLMPTLPCCLRRADRAPDDGEGQGDVKAGRQAAGRETDGETDREIACHQTDHGQTDHGRSEADRQTVGHQAADREATTAKPTPAKTTAPPAAKPTTAAPKPTTAPPRSNPYTPQQACGAGFSVQQAPRSPGDGLTSSTTPPPATTARSR